MGCDLFWSLTPREVAVHFKAAGERDRRAHNDRAWLAFNTAFLPHQKRPPKLRDLQIHNAAGRRVQSPEERLRMAQQWAAVARAKG